MRKQEMWMDADMVAEKIENNGIDSFSDTELLKMALGDTETLFSESMAKAIRDVFDSKTGFEETFSRISNVEGLQKEKAIALSAMVEFARRKVGRPSKKATRPQDVFEAVKHYFDEEQERFIVLGVNGGGEIIFSKVVTVGLLDRTLIHPREVFSDALKMRCSSIFVAHNHPSRNLEPSSPDKASTHRLKEAGELLGIQLLDHIIFTDDDFYSFREHGEM